MRVHKIGIFGGLIPQQWKGSSVGEYCGVCVGRGKSFKFAMDGGSPGHVVRQESGDTEVSDHGADPRGATSSDSGRDRRWSSSLSTVIKLCTRGGRVPSGWA